MRDEREVHEKRPLAASEVCAVERCAGCGVLHLHFGATTVRFTADAFLALCDTLLAARARMLQEVAGKEEQRKTVRRAVH